MTTATILVTRAFREGNIIPVGKAPTADELAEGLAIINSYMLGLFGIHVGKKPMEWPVPNHQRTAGPTRDYPLRPGAHRELSPQYNEQVPPNSRIVWDGSTQHVYLYPKPSDGALIALALGSGANAADVGSITIDGNGRRISGAATFVMAESEFAAMRWFYRADLAEWVQIKALALGDEMIFPEEFDDLWVCAGMVRLAPRFGKAVTPATAGRGGEVMAMLQSRYFQSQSVTSGGDQLVAGFQSFDTTSRRDGWM